MKPAILAAMFVAAAPSAGLPDVSAAATQSIAIPAYFYPAYPDPLWTQMETSVPGVSFAVMNPASGPGAAPDSNYVSQVTQTRAAGVKIIGYVASTYAARPLADIKDEIDDYYSWYDVDGIFIDEADNNCVSAAYYAVLDDYTKAKGGLGLTVINPGTTAPECFAASADVILNFEGSYTQYQSWTPLGWEAGYDASRFWHLVYATSESEMPAAVLLSQERGAGYVYVTPDVLANPWDTLPGESYWQTELAYVQPTSGGCPAAVSKARLQVKGIDTIEADDSLKFSGRFTLAGTPAIDPVANGIRIVIGDDSAVETDVTLPPGAYAGESGWTGKPGKWNYRDTSASPAGGITKASIRTKLVDGSTLVTFNVSGKYGPFPVSAEELPLSGALLLDPADPTSDCGNAAFPGVEACVATGDGRKIRCK